MLHEHKGYDSRGWEREPGPVWFDLCYAMQSNRETAQMKGVGWNSSGVVVLHWGQKAARMNLMHFSYWELSTMP